MVHTAIKLRMNHTLKINHTTINLFYRLLLFWLKDWSRHPKEYFLMNSTLKFTKKSFNYMKRKSLYVTLFVKLFLKCKNLNLLLTFFMC